MTIDDAVRAWLGRDDHDVTGWAPPPPAPECRCTPALTELLVAIARPVRGTACAWVHGVPVVLHPSGAPIACAAGSDWLVIRSAQPAGALAPRADRPETGNSETGNSETGNSGIGLAADWVRCDPWATDTTFTRTRQLLHAQVRRAFDRATERATRRA